MVSTRLACGKLPPPKRANVKDLSDEEGSLDGDESESESECGDEVRPDKKAKTSETTAMFYQRTKGGKMKPVPNTKGQKPQGKSVGRLSKIVDVPMEIFCEITSYLMPLDILQISRTSIKLHDMLCSRQSRPIWRAARKNVPLLPDCPVDLSEAQFARLVFAKECYSCGVSSASMPDYTLRARLCGRCKKEQTVKGSILLRQYPKLKVEFLDILPFRFRLCNYTRRGSHQEFFYKPDVRAILKRFKSMKNQSGAWEKYLEERKAVMTHLGDSAKELTNWKPLYEEAVRLEHRMSMKAEQERVLERDQRIRKMLYELGYAENDLPHRHAYRWYSIIAAKAELTPSYWTSILPEVKICIGEHIEQQLEQARQKRVLERKVEISELIAPKLLSLRLQSSFARLTTPQLPDVYALPSVAKLIMAEDSTIPITLDMWSAILHDVLDEIEEHKKRVRKDLQEMVLEAREGLASTIHGHGRWAVASSSKSAPDISLDSLDCLFSCTRCQKILIYPDMLGHRCIIGYASSPSPWTATTLRIRQNTPLIVHSLLKDLRFSIEKALLSDVEAMGKRFVCLCCDEKLRIPMTWAGLITHFHEEIAWFDEAQRAPLSSFARRRSAGETRTEYRRFLKDTSNIARPTIHKDHSIESSKPLVAFLKYGGALQQFVTIVDLQKTWGTARFSCGICPRKGSSFNNQAKTREHTALHIRHKHLKEPADGDIISFHDYFPYY